MRLSILCAILLTAGAHAQEWEIRVDLQMVALPMAQALLVVPQLRNAETFAAAEARVAAMLASGEAELLGWPFVQMKSGDRARSGSIDEVRYPTDYDPPMLPSGIGNGLGAIRTPFYYIVNPPERYITPTAFETRNAGPALEVAASVRADGRSIDLEIAPQFVRLEAGEHTIGTRAEYPGDHYQQQPRFTTQRTEAAFTLPNDGRRLLSTFVLREPQPRLLLFLVHAVATRTPPSR